MSNLAANTHKGKPVWVLVNREGTRLLQYGYSIYEDEAQRLLVCARQRHPDAGIHLENVNID